MRLRCWSVGVLGLVAGLSGCGEARNPWEVVNPARGVITYKGAPLGRAMITLVPQDSSVPATVRPSATSSEDGTFVLGTYSRGDGAPEGQYKVVVLRFPVVGSKSNPVAGPNDLPRRYSRAETTDLTLTLSGETSDLPELKLK